MLKIKNGIVIQGRFDSPEEGLVKLVREASFSTIIVHSRLKSYEDHLPELKGKALVKRKLKVRNINKLLEEFK